MAIYILLNAQPPEQSLLPDVMHPHHLFIMPCALPVAMEADSVDELALRQLVLLYHMYVVNAQRERILAGDDVELLEALDCVYERIISHVESC